MDVIIIQRIFPKYRKDVFDELHNKIDFVLLHSKNNTAIKQVKADYAKQISSIQYSTKETHCFLNAFNYILKNRPKVIIHEFSMGILSLIPTYYLSSFLGIKFILWGHGYDRIKGFCPQRSLLDKIRLLLLKKADAVILYGKEAKVLISEYILSEKLFVAYNCLNTAKLNAIRDRLECEGLENVKKRIGFTHEYNLIFIGRILESKQPQKLIDVYKHLKSNNDISLCIHFVGNGDCLSELKETVKTNSLEKDIIFHGDIYDETASGELLYCSNLMVMPGYVGLAVNHALNFDCPVVTWQKGINGPFHSPEIEYLIDQETGYFVQEQTIEAMSLIVSNYLFRKDIQLKMKKNIRKIIETTLSINNFITGFKDAIEHVLENNRRCLT